MLRSSLSRLCLAVGLSIGAACGEASDGPGGTVELQPCRIEGIPRPARCGTVTVAEDRARAGSGATIDLRVVVIPAQREGTPDPIFMLAGGPGQAATEAYPALWGALRDLARDRDLVLIDQRGTGKSSPLACEDDEDPPLERLLDPTPDLERLKACAASLKHDPKHFVTTVAVDDFDQVREALGYDKINLIGGSYGTRAALVYARQHPDRVRSLVLDGVAPVGMALPLSFARDAQRVFDLVVQACAAQQQCAAAFPDPAGDLRVVLEHLGDDGRAVEVEHPRTGERVTVRLSAATVASGVRGLLYSPQLAALLPWTLRRAAAGDLQPLITQFVVLSGGITSSMSMGLMLSVLCAEDVAGLTDAQIERESANTFLGARSVEDFRAMCRLWPHAQVPADYLEPVTSDAPALLLSGTLDPATPPRWAEIARRGLPNSRHVEVPGAGHGTLGLPCVRDLLRDFIDNLDPASLEPACGEASIQFFIDFAGPPA